ncbi:MAG: hypothetical protein AAF226_01680, partial [Verrucomicrobiota bacterium]
MTNSIQAKAEKTSEDLENQVGSENDSANLGSPALHEPPENEGPREKAETPKAPKRRRFTAVLEKTEA